MSPLETIRAALIALYDSPGNEDLAIDALARLWFVWAVISRTAEERDSLTRCNRWAQQALGLPL